MNTKSRGYLLSVIFFGVCIILASCKNKDEYTISLVSETELENVSERENVTDFCAQSKESSSDELSEDGTYVDIGGVMNSKTTAFVYITGQVKNPGVYSISEEGRIYQVVELAGGFTSKASKECLNLAQKVVDGQHIHVLSKSQYKEVQTAGNNSQIQDEKGTDDSRVDINVATEEELMQLPGIGESKAKAIIAYRTENGSFQSIEEIKHVPGIKEGAYDKIKLLIKV